MINTFGGYETTNLKMALNRNKQKYVQDSIDRIDEIIQGTKFNDKIKLKKIQKYILKYLVKRELLKEDGYEDFTYDYIDANTIVKMMIRLLHRNELMAAPYNYYLSLIFFDLRQTEYDSIPSDSYHKYKNLLLNNFIIILYKLNLITIDPYFNFYDIYSIDEIMNYFNDVPRLLDSDIYNSFGGYETDKLEQLEQFNHFGKSKIPENVINKKLYLKIKAKIQREIKRKKRRWGAYDSGRLVREYKKNGGKYKGKKNNSKLERWYKEKWIDACKWPKKSPCGRSKAKQKLTYCRPSIKINSQTPKTIQEFTKKEIKSKCLDKKKK